MKYEITTYQIEKLADENSIVKDCLKEWFPEVFKTELEVGKWYKMKGNTHFLCNFNGNIGNNGNSYGFNMQGKWMDDSMCFQNCDTYVEATPEEVESSLINEAKKRGFKKGVKVVGLYSDGRPHQVTDFIINNDDFTYKTLNNALVYNKLGFRIFANGKWAEILPQEKTVVPMEKALKIIAKKMKVSPENIEIQS